MAHTHKDEALAFGRYLLRREPDALSVSLYEEAMQKRPPEISARDEKLIRFAVKKRWAIGLLDSALAFARPQPALRKKLLVMSAILETRPAYSDLFLPKERSFFYLFYIGLVGCRAVCKAIAGKILLAFI